MSLASTILRRLTLLGVIAAALLGAIALSTPAQAATPQKIVGLASQKCVDIRAEDAPAHARAQMWQCYGSPNQRFTFNRVARTSSAIDMYQIVDQQTGQCLQVRGNSVADGAAVERATCNAGDNNQRWWFSDPILSHTETDFGYMALRNARTDKCLDVNANSTANGAYVQQWTCNGTTAQAWKTFT